MTGKYELIETDKSDPEAAAEAVAAKILPCKLDTATKELVELIFRLDGSILVHLVIDLKSPPPATIRPADNNIMSLHLR